MTIQRIILPSLEGIVLGDGAAARARAQLMPSFDAKPEAPDAPPSPPPITQEDVKAAEQEGYRRGFLEGEREGRAAAETEQTQILRELNHALHQQAAQIERIILDYNQFVARQKQILPQVALAVARKISGDALQENAYALVQQSVAECVSTLLGEPQITVFVQQKLASALEERLIALFAHRQEPGEITILGDADMPPGDFRIEWKDGQAARDTAQLWQQVENIIEGMLDSARREPPALDAHSPDGQF